MIMERGKAYDESERSKKRTSNKNEHFKQQDEVSFMKVSVFISFLFSICISQFQRFKTLGEEVDKEFGLLQHELVTSKRETLNKGPDVVMDKIGEWVNYIRKSKLLCSFNFLPF